MTLVIKFYSRTIIWVCPPWSDQIPPGVHNFQIGRVKVFIVQLYALKCAGSGFAGSKYFGCLDPEPQSESMEPDPMNKIQMNYLKKGLIEI